MIRLLEKCHEERIRFGITAESQAAASAEVAEAVRLDAEADEAEEEAEADEEAAAAAEAARAAAAQAQAEIVAALERANAALADATAAAEASPSAFLAACSVEELATLLADNAWFRTRAEQIRSKWCPLPSWIVDLLTSGGDLQHKILEHAVCAQTIATVPAVCGAWRASFPGVLDKLGVPRPNGSNSCSQERRFLCTRVLFIRIRRQTPYQQRIWKRKPCYRCPTGVSSCTIARRSRLEPCRLGLRSSLHKVRHVMSSTILIRIPSNGFTTMARRYTSLWLTQGPIFTVS